MWEIRRVVLASHVQPKKCFRLCKWIRDNQAEWSVIFASLGCHPCIKNSVRAAIEQGDDMHDPLLRQ
eukprot:1903937-Alexandrium_andersonii.AAC.1